MFFYKTFHSIVRYTTGGFHHFSLQHYTLVLHLLAGPAGSGPLKKPQVYMVLVNHLQLGFRLSEVQPFDKLQPKNKLKQNMKKFD